MEIYEFVRTVIILAIARISHGYEFVDCYGKYYNQLSCEAVNTTISIISGEYGLSSCGNNCCPDRENDCLIPMPDGDLQKVKDACDSRKRCSGLERVGWDRATACGSAAYTNYVVVKYDCVTDDGKIVTEPPGPDSSTSSSKTEGPESGTLVTGTVTQFPGIGGNDRSATGNPTDTGMIVGIVVAGILVLLLVVLVVTAIYVKRRQPAWADDLPKVKLPKFNSPLFKKEKSTPPPPNKGLGSPRQVTQNTTRYQQGAVNPGFRTDSTMSAVSSGTLGTSDEWSGPYTGAQVVRTPQDAIDAMKSDDESMEEENIYDVIGEEPRRSVDVEQGLYPESMTVRHARSSIPSEVAPDIPDVIPRNSDRREPRQISGVEQVTINDDVYYCPLEGNKQSPGSSVEDIYDDNEDPNKHQSDSRPASDYVRPIQFRGESQYLDLQPHLMSNGIYTQITPPKHNGYLDQDGQENAYYLDVVDDQYPSPYHHSEI